MLSKLRDKLKKDLVTYCEPTPDPSEESQNLLTNIVVALPDLDALAGSCEGDDEDGPYRFYHQSFKVYRLQARVVAIVAALRPLSPDPSRPLDAFFEQIVSEGTGRRFEEDGNAAWMTHARHILEAYFHARWFLDLAIAFGHEYPYAPNHMDSGWAALLSLYSVR